MWLALLDLVLCFYDDNLLLGALVRPEFFHSRLLVGEDSQLQYAEHGVLLFMSYFFDRGWLVLVLLGFLFLVALVFSLLLVLVFAL